MRLIPDEPFGDQILVKPVEKAQVLVSDDGTLSEHGQVVAIGQDVKRIKVGQFVAFSVFGIEKAVIDDNKYYFIRENPEFLLTTLKEVED